MFNAYIHHFSLYVFLVSQNLYMNDAVFRELNKQANYYIIFDNVRARGSLKILSRTLFDKHGFLNRYLEDIRKKDPYGHLIIDLTNNQREFLRVRSGWPFKTDAEMFIYIP